MNVHCPHCGQFVGTLVKHYSAHHECKPPFRDRVVEALAQCGKWLVVLAIAALAVWLFAFGGYMG